MNRVRKEMFICRVIPQNSPTGQHNIYRNPKRVERENSTQPAEYAEYKRTLLKRIFAARCELKIVIDSAVTNYHLALPVSFHCPECKKTHRLRGDEAEKQTPRDELPIFLTFRCPGCQTMVKARIEQA